MPMRMRRLPARWMALLAAAGVLAGTVRAHGAPGGEPVAAAPSRTIEWSAASPVTGAPTGAVVAQSQITAGPLQGPLNVPGVKRQRPSSSCPIRPVHRRRVAARAAPVRLAAVPVVPLVPIYAYPPPVVYRPVVPVYAFRPFYRPFLYRPFFYRPYFYRPYFYRGFY